jgi:hypothetical protein
MSTVVYPFYLGKMRQLVEIKDYVDLLSAFDQHFMDSPLNELEEPDADEMIDLFRQEGWAIEREENK